MRLFIAIPLAPHLKNALNRTQSALRTRGVQGNFTPAENFHLTLAFIGEYPEPESVLEVMESVPFHSFPLVLEGLSAFEQVWWAGVQENPELHTYVKRLRRGLAEAGIPMIGRNSRPTSPSSASQRAGERRCWPGFTSAESP